jgi:glycosyltransferase involved in cell wall biosynthesis
MPDGKQSMRVVHISKVVAIAGSEGHLLNLLPGLEARGVSTHMLVMVEPRRPMLNFMARWQEIGIDAASLPIYHDLDLTAVTRLARHLRHLQPDVVHTHLIHADLYGTLAARLTGTQTIISTRHNDDAFRRHPLVRMQIRALDRLTGHYIAISEWLRQYTIKQERMAPDKVTTVHYGLPPANPEATLTPNGLRSSLNVGLDTPLVGVVARLVEQKGLAYLLDAFRHVVSELPAAQLVVVGDGPLRSQLKARAAALGIAENVLFTGWRDDAQRIIAAVDMLAMPSLWEGFGLVALEAMAHAKPIVATRVSTLPEVILDGPDGTGWLVPPRDPDALADALLHALRQPEIASAQGQRGYERLTEHFSPERMADQTLDIYERLLARRDRA